VKPVVRNFGEVFGLEVREASLEDLLARLAAQTPAGEANLEHAHVAAVLS
jgi:hypothetical protein